MPLCVCVLEPSAFAETWPNRPKEPVSVGLRMLSDAEEHEAGAYAERRVLEMELRDPEGIVDAYNGVLMRALLRCALCSDEDIRIPSRLFPVPEDELLGRALKPFTVRYLFERLERAKVETGPLHPEASDFELIKLGRKLIADGCEGLTPGRARLVRRFARFILEQLTTDYEPAAED